MAILGFVPAFLVPLIATMVGIYAITRILTPEDYGIYALAITVMTLCQSALFSWLDLGAKRFFEKAAGSGRLPVLVTTIYIGLAFSTSVLVMAGFGGFALERLGIVQLDPRLLSLLGISAAVLVAKEASMLSKVLELAALSRLRYTLMECAESILGLCVGLVLCWYGGLGVQGILLGMLVGAVAVVLEDGRRIVARLRGGRFDRVLNKEVLAFAAPISVAFFFEYIVASSDRFLIGAFLGSGELGIYAVSYSIAERAVTAVFLAVGLASYPLIVRAFERSGADAARQQALLNAEMLVTLAIPAWGGFTIASPHIAMLLVGPAFSQRAAELMPLIGAGVFLYGLRTHYFSHVQHLSNRTWGLLTASIPAAVLNVAMNCLLLPQVGIIGAVWSRIAAYALALVISVWQARRDFALPFPVWQAAKATFATAVMCAALRWLKFPMTASGLAELIVTGGAIYGFQVMLFDIGRMRGAVLRMRSRLIAPGSAHLVKAAD